MLEFLQWISSYRESNTMDSHGIFSIAALTPTPVDDGIVKKMVQS